MNSSSTQPASLFQNDMSGYVAELQLHMSLQAKNLVPALDPNNDSLHQLLHESQTNLEKLVSRYMAA